MITVREIAPRHFRSVRFTGEGVVGGLDQRAHRIEEMRVGGKDLARMNRPAAEVAGDASGLASDDLAGSEIPGTEELLEVDVDAPGCDIAEVGRGGADAADVAHFGDHMAKAADLTQPAFRLVAEPGGDEALCQVRRRRRVDGMSVERRPFAAG